MVTESDHFCFLALFSGIFSLNRVSRYAESYFKPCFWDFDWRNDEKSVIKVDYFNYFKGSPPFWFFVKNSIFLPIIWFFMFSCSFLVRTSWSLSHVITEKSGPELALESTLRRNFENFWLFYVIFSGPIIYQIDRLLMAILNKRIKRNFDHDIGVPESSLYPQLSTSGKNVPKNFLWIPVGLKILQNKDLG